MSGTDPYNNPNLTSATLNSLAGLIEPLEASSGVTNVRPVSNGVRPILNIGFGIDIQKPDELKIALYAMYWNASKKHPTMVR